MELDQNRVSGWEPWETEQPAKEEAAAPFADSPYIMGVNQEEEAQKDNLLENTYASAPTQSEGVKGRNAGNIWLGVLAAIMVVAMTAGCCVLTALTLSSRFEQQLALMREEMNRELDAMQGQLDTFLSAWGVGEDEQTHNGFTPAQVYAMNVKSVVAVATQSGTGSGFIISADGYIVTNYHVVASATVLQVTTADQEVHSAKLIGYDSGRDVALLKIDAEGLPFVKFGSSNALSVGDQVLAIGNPLGELTATLTVGVVSAKDRIINTDGLEQNMLQTDAAINSGNSGGPLFNMNGEVVGITTAKYSGFSSSGATIEGIGFAIPIDDVLSIIDALYNQVLKPGAYLGIYVRDVEQTVIDDYGLPAGAYVVDVIAGYCAEQAGVQAKDIIIAIDDNKVTSVDVLGDVMKNYKPGDTAQVTVLRSGVEVKLSVTFGAAPVDMNQ